MELRTLQYFFTVAREENITRASEVLHITQPTLSRQMKQLEQELGTELFVRGRNFALTEAGMLLRRRAEEVVDMMYKIEYEIETVGEVGGVISIGSGALKSSQFLPEVMSAFQKLHPKVRFEIYSNSSQYIKERMDRGLLDFGIMLEPIDIEQYEYIRIRLFVGNFFQPRYVFAIYFIKNYAKSAYKKTHRVKQHGALSRRINQSSSNTTLPSLKAFMRASDSRW